MANISSSLGRGSIEVRGLAQLNKALKTLPETVQRNVLSRAVVRGARIIQRAAKSRAPVLSGNLRKNIIVSRGVRRGTEASAFVIIRKWSQKAIAAFKKRSKKKGRANPRDPFYWQFLEFGTSKMAARPFMRPAFEAKKEEAAKEVRDALREEIEKELRKLAWGALR